MSPRAVDLSHEMWAVYAAMTRLVDPNDPRYVAGEYDEILEHYTQQLVDLERQQRREESVRIARVGVNLRAPRHLSLVEAA